METVQYIFVLIAVSPFVIWGAILYGLSIVAPLREEQDAPLSLARTGTEPHGSTIHLTDLPDVTVEHYYLRQMERTPSTSG